ncbi:MAG: signal peptide peptidase SppA [Alphaproteobacteria bacterium]|nr:signal peptide peptidase SppA [Alphaproteobacteria bacterium]
MAWDDDMAAARRKLRRRLLFWRLIATGLALALVLVALSREGLLERDHVARIAVSGLLLEDGQRAAAIEALGQDEAVSAVIVHIDSPGGTVVGGEQLYRSIRRTAEAKPVAVVMGTLAASGGYMAALAGERLFARDGTITGSIGVILQSVEVSELLENLGIRANTVRSGLLKGEPSPLAPLSEAGRAALETVVNDMFAFFVDLVAERRAMPRERALALADGRIYTGRQAVANGLVDELGDERAAREWLARVHGIPLETPVRNVNVEEDDGAVSKVLGALVKKSLYSKALSLDGLVSVWHPSLR